MPELAAISILAIAIGAVASAALGALWYSPLLFANAWMTELGKSEEELAPAGAAMAGSILSCFVAATAIELLVVATGTASLLGGLAVGAVVGFGVVAMTMLSDSLFSDWGWRLYLLQAGYRVLYLVMMGAVSGFFHAS